MVDPSTLLFLILATIGHGLVWVALVNRSHAVGMPQGLCHLLTALMFFSAAGIPLAVAWSLYSEGLDRMFAPMAGKPTNPLAVYLGLCSLAGVWAVAQWSWRNVWPGVRRPERYCRSRRCRLLPLPGSPGLQGEDASLLARLPRNEVLWLEEIDRGLELPRLPEALEGLSILHLSDLHWTGGVGKSYFVELVRRCNLRHPDLVALTGDFVDTEACFDWVPDTLAKLRARWGVYFVLGNHERRVDSVRLRTMLGEAGLVDLGGRWMEVEIRGERVVLAGNEIPWFRPAADLHGAPPSSLRGGPFRIVLAHCPDQLVWARREEADLLLVGHTHGGQVCLPGIGPIFSPCLQGVRYIRGTYAAPPTVMHVSQGVSAELPFRFRCMPEAALLMLHAAGGTASSRPDHVGQAVPCE